MVTFGIEKCDGLFPAIGVEAGAGVGGHVEFSVDIDAVLIDDVLIDDDRFFELFAVLLAIFHLLGKKQIPDFREIELSALTLSPPAFQKDQPEVCSQTSVTSVLTR